MDELCSTPKTRGMCMRRAEYKLTRLPVTKSSRWRSVCAECAERIKKFSREKLCVVKLEGQ